MRINNNVNNFNVRPEVWICLFLVLSTLFIYFQVGTFDFVIETSCKPTFLEFENQFLVEILGARMTIKPKPDRLQDASNKTNGVEGEGREG